MLNAKKRSYKVAIHAGEASRDDISDALSLEPDFLVHLCKAENEDMKKIKALDISAVICARSNLMTGASLPNLTALLQNEITAGAGTDNVMLNPPDMFSEMNFIYRTLLHDDRQVFKMCTLNGAKILGLDHRVGSICENKEARVMVINRNSNNMWGSSNPLASVLHQFVAPATPVIPDEAAAVLWIAPERDPPGKVLAALDAYLRRGGRLVALLEPGPAGGLGELLARWGIEPAGGVVVDPASARVDGCAEGLCPLVYAYATSHPIARGLDDTRMTFFRGARSFRLRKPELEDQLVAVALASARSWLAPDLAVLTHGAPLVRPPDEGGDYHPLLVAGSYRRGARETRIVAIGDADLASNHDLRALFNLDLVLNAVHWATAREPAITLRPKVAVSGKMQFRIPLQNTFTRFQSLGLLLPELLLILAAFVWGRTRTR